MEHDEITIATSGNILNIDGESLGYLWLFIRFTHEVLPVVLDLDHSDLIDRLLAFMIFRTQDLISIL